MTTIAYKEGIIAYDSRLTSGDVMTIRDDNYDKHRVINKIHFFLTGPPSSYDAFIKAYIENDTKQPNLDVAAIVFEDGKVYSSSISDSEKIWKFDITDSVYAIGSGSDHAYTAMDCGLSAREAVKMTIKRDVCSGGRVRIFKTK